METNTNKLTLLSPIRENKLSYQLEPIICQILLYFKHLGIITSPVFQTNPDRVILAWKKTLLAKTTCSHRGDPSPWPPQWGPGGPSQPAPRQVRLHHPHNACETPTWSWSEACVKVKGSSTLSKTGALWNIYYSSCHLHILEEDQGCWEDSPQGKTDPLKDILCCLENNLKKKNTKTHTHQENSKIECKRYHIEKATANSFLTYKYPVQCRLRRKHTT